MRVITISRTYGSEGSALAKKLAERLGYSFADESLIKKVSRNKEAAAQLIVNLEDETSPDFLDSILELMNSRSYFKMSITAGLYELALRKDMVIVGGGGHLILSDYPAMLSVQIYKNLKDRARHISEEKNIPYDAAVNLIEKRDNEKKRFVSHYFDQELFDPVAFHLTLNTSLLSLEDALDIIGNYSERYFRDVDFEAAEDALQKRLLAKRAELLMFHVKLARGSKIQFESSEQRSLTARGVVGSKEQKSAILKALRSLRGVDKVEDQLKVSPLSRMIY